MSAQKETEGPNPKRKLFYGLFLFPLLVVVGMAALLCTVVFLTHEEETPESLITAIKTGSPSKRWQKAFELSNELNRNPKLIRGRGILQEMIHILNDPDHYDGKTRGYMAMALSRFKEPEVVQAIRKRLPLENEEVALYLIWAFGNLGDPEVAEDLRPFLRTESPVIRKMAAYVLGVLGDKKMTSDIKPLLNDSVADVSWNAALSLARLGDDSGWKVLMRMLDRTTLAAHTQMSKTETEFVMINAVKAVALLNRPDARLVLESLARTDESLKVRQAALEALQYQKEGSSHG